MLVARRLRDDPTVTAFVPPMDLSSRLRRLLRRREITRSFTPYRMSRPEGNDRFSHHRSEHGDSLLRQLPPCDVINLHWIATFVDYQAFFPEVIRHTPVVWRLPDMNPFTGGCHYDDGCGRFAERCGACPQLGSTDPEDLSASIWRRKQAIYGRIVPGGVHIVATSRWMADQVEGSVLLHGFPVTIIPNGVDTEDFSPRDQRFARNLFDIPQEAKVVLFAATSLDNRRKGFELLVQALARIRDVPKLLLVSVGRGKALIDGRIPHVHLGHMENDRSLSLAYSAADVFAIPSRQEAFGLTALESLACGTPVVGFAAGGVPDMVRPGITGLLAPVHDVKALASAIVQVLQDPEARAEMAANCRRIAVQEYALETQAQRYRALYEMVLANHSRSRTVR